MTDTLSETEQSTAAAPRAERPAGDSSRPDPPPGGCEAARPMRADARRNRERILQAARDVFAKSGAEAQIDDVARHAGVGVGTVYRHFPTKEALMAELVRQKFRLLADSARAALDRDGEPFDVLADLLRANADLCARDAAMQLAISGAGERAWSQARSEQQELFTLTDELLARGQQAGTLRADIRAADIAMLMSGVTTTIALGLPGFDWRRHLELAIDVLRAR